MLVLYLLPIFNLGTPLNVQIDSFLLKQYFLSIREYLCKKVWKISAQHRTKASNNLFQGQRYLEQTFFFFFLYQQCTDWTTRKDSLTFVCFSWHLEGKSSIDRDYTFLLEIEPVKIYLWCTVTEKGIAHIGNSAKAATHSSQQSRLMLPFAISGIGTNLGGYILPSLIIFN